MKLKAIRYSEANLTAQSLEFLEEFHKDQSDTLVLCESETIASSLKQNFDNLSLALKGEHASTLFTMGWEQSPYSGLSPSVDVQMNRLQSLTYLSTPKRKPTIIFTSALGALQKTIPPSLLALKSISLSIGDEIEISNLSASLSEIGYLREDFAVEPGTYSIRGDILDYYPMTLDAPKRIEFFDNEIERIREYDPESQRALSNKNFPSVTIPIANEVKIFEAETAGFFEKLKTFCDDNHVPKQTRDGIRYEVKNRRSPVGLPYWVSLVYDRPACLFNFLNPKFRLHTSEITSLSKHLSDRHETLNNEYEATRRLPSVSLDPSKIYDFDGVEMLVDSLGIQCSQFGFEQPSTRRPSNIPKTQPEEDRTEYLVRVISTLNKTSVKLHLFSYKPSSKKLVSALLENRQVNLVNFDFHKGNISDSYLDPSRSVCLLSIEELVGHNSPDVAAAKTKKTFSSAMRLKSLSENGLVVHNTHGIGIYRGSKVLEHAGTRNEFLVIEYDRSDKLYLPVYRLDQIQPYSGSKSNDVRLSKLGGDQFSKTKNKVKSKLREIAIDLVALYAERRRRPGMAFPTNNELYRIFESEFPFQETVDQSSAIQDVLNDLSSGRIMDRLICGDVGFGKTEVAMRAAAAAVINGHQVAILTPTTVLTYQHEQTFKNRFKNMPIEVASISRFKSRKEQREVVAGLASGSIDVVIGTHRLLSKDIDFRKLGLLVVDEEHRFGVEHKEKIKALATTTHVLTLTATPIPRTLQMAMGGLKDVSLISTAPKNRSPISTFVGEESELTIRNAITKELSRGGQVFFLHNRVKSIVSVQKKIKALLPSARVAIAHGQMKEGELESTFVRFSKKELDVLVCTTIIESGLDLPTVNTIIIDRAEALGLAQLYQIRGRVGRGSRKAYAYLLTPSLTNLSSDGRQRLEVIQKHVELGSGFNVASYDLEIRGGGNLLGAEQSGHIQSVGFELFNELLEDAIKEVRGGGETENERDFNPEITVPFSSYIDNKYISSSLERLKMYRRLNAADSTSELGDLEAELEDRFGKIPLETENLFWVLRLKLLMRDFGIQSLTYANSTVGFLPSQKTKIHTEKILERVRTNGLKWRITPKTGVIVSAPCPNVESLFIFFQRSLRELAQQRCD